MEAGHRFTRRDPAFASGSSLAATPRFRLYANAQTVGFVLFKMCRVPERVWCRYAMLPDAFDPVLFKLFNLKEPCHVKKRRLHREDENPAG